MVHHAFFALGQTWLMTIMYLINNAEKLEAGEEIPRLGLEVFRFMEFIYPDDVLGAEIVEKLPPPRVMKTHLPLKFYKKQLDAYPATKVVQITRNPKDTLVSFYHFYRMNKGLGHFKGTFSDFFAMFERKELVFGDLFEHTAEWYKYLKDRDNSLILVYEDMKRDLKGNISKICKFLGRDLPEHVIDLIVTKTTFDNMSKDKALNQSYHEHFDKKKSTFLRKGKVGDWVEYFNEEESKIFDQKSKEFFEPLGLNYEYQ